MSLAKYLVFIGIGIALIGVLIWLGVPLGKLPGDIRAEGEKTRVYFPIVTCIIVSIVLTVGINLIFWIMRK